MCEDEHISYGTCDVPAAALGLRVSGSCDPTESRVFSMSILLLRRARRIHTFYHPKVPIICEPADQSSTAQETQLIPQNLIERMLISSNFASVFTFYPSLFSFRCWETYIYNVLNWEWWLRSNPAKMRIVQLGTLQAPPVLVPWGERCTIHFNASASSGKAALCK